MRDAANSTPRALGFNCSQCVHFKGIAKKPEYDKSCYLLGVQSFAPAPSCFSADTNQLVTASLETIASLGKELRSLTDVQLRLVGYTLIQAANLHNVTGRRFGQPVFFSLGEDVLSHYAKGVVVGFDKENGLTYVGATIEQQESPISVLMPTDSLMSVSEWRAKSQQLIKEGKVTWDETTGSHNPSLWPIPEIVSRQIKMVSDETLSVLDYDPPSLASVPAEWLAPLAVENSVKHVGPGQDKQVKTVAKTKIINNEDDSTVTIE